MQRSSHGTNDRGALFRDGDGVDRAVAEAIRAVTGSVATGKRATKRAAPKRKVKGKPRK